MRPVAFLDAHTAYFESFVGHQPFGIFRSLDFFKTMLVYLQEKRGEISTATLVL